MANVYLPSRRFAAFLLASLLICATGAAHELKLAPFKPTGIYDVGESAGWTVSRDTGTAAGKYTYVLKRNNFDVIKSGEFDLASLDSVRIDVTLDAPAMLFLELKRVGNGDGKPIVAGAAVASTRLQPVAPRPADFDAFWAGNIKALQAVPANPVLTPKDPGRADVDFAIVKMDHVDGGHVHGQLAKPKEPGKRPALLVLQWASPPYPLEKGWVTEHAGNGWLTLNIEPHDVLPDEPQAYYDALPNELKEYHKIGWDDRDKSYFLRMYLAGYRAVDYLTAHPDWDGKTLVVMGTSMGGQQSLAVAGLHSKVTHVIVNEPAGCDMNASLHGRQMGYPFFPADNAKVMEAARYFDPIHFASRISATSLVSMGFIDTVTPPAGIWTAFNQIKGPKEAAPMVDSPHNHLATPEQQRPYTKRSAEWLAALVKGQPVRPGS